MKFKFLFFGIFFILCSFLRAQNEFITVWKPSNTGFIPSQSTANQIYFPGIGDNYTIYWEEVGYPSHNGTLSNITTVLNVPLLIDFGTPLNPIANNATYTLKVSQGNGNFNRICFYAPLVNYRGDSHKIIKVTQWGDIHWSSMERAFHYSTEMDVTATDIPDLSNLTTMSGMFAGCYNLVGNPSINNWDVSQVTNFSDCFNFATKFNQPVTNWDISNATDISSMFANAYLFDQPVGNWDTSNVTNMARTFMTALVFNQPLANWNTSKVTDMSQLFFDTQLFDQPIGNWDTSKVTNMMNLFHGTEMFNQPITNWDTSKVTSIAFMFSRAHKFNQPIGNWDTSSVTDMRGVFSENRAFNQPIENWDTSQVTDMEQMFAQSEKFNQPIGNWNTSNVTNMFAMFYISQAFNQPIGNWDTSKVTNMLYMFTGALVFNQPIGNWDTSKVTDMRHMFKNASKFNQDLGTWNLSHVTQIDNMLDFSGLKCNNYNSTLYGWANNSSTPNNLILGASGLKYSTAQAIAARNTLSNGKGWSIVNDIYDPECDVLSTSEVNKKNFRVYPNPVKNTLFFSEDLQNIEVYSIDGKLLKRSAKGNRIDIPELLKGIYILKATDLTGNLISQKFIKE